MYKRRFVFIGDAGYAPDFTGAGTTLAIAGTYVLAGEVGRHKENLAAGHKGSEEQMRPVIDDFRRIPPLLSTIFAPQTAWEYGCGTMFSLSSLGPESWNSLRDSSSTPLPALINKGPRIMNGRPEEQKYRASSTHNLAPVYYEQAKEVENEMACVSNILSLDRDYWQ